ncbi:hypothetical protein [Hymenobacter terricola]|uniref:hypothetical protein n=1 Tax=Hymenobacter terricola TaxID=2819236 RepID=UPI001B307483|nr:hypothetical protein [Hymenobacter terricola]
MADNDDATNFDQSADENEDFDAELRRQADLLPPELFETMKPLLMLGSLANYILMGHDEDPVPRALEELLGYDLEAVRNVTDAKDTLSLARVMARHTLQLFDFISIARLVFESRLDAPLRAYLGRFSASDDEFVGPREYVLTSGESLLENIGQYLSGGDADLREELRMRRLQTESIFARLDETLRPFYPSGNSPDEDRARALDDVDEAEDEEEPAVHVNFNEVQRVTLSTALRLPWLLTNLGETPFARALAEVRRFRKKALERLADRLTMAGDGEPFALTWSELLRLYQAAQVCALSTVTNVVGAGSLEDMMLHDPAHAADAPDEVAQEARHARELMLLLMAGFVETIEVNHPDDEDVAEAKAEISRLAELLAE